MSQELKQNIIHELAEDIEQGKAKFQDLEKETRDIIIWYLRIDKGISISDIAVGLKCERNTVSSAIKRLMRQRAVQLEKEGIDLWTEFIRFKQGIGLVQNRALAQGDLSVYLQSLKAYMDELRKCGFIKEGVKESQPIELNVNNLNVVISQVLELFSAIPTERLKEIADSPVRKHKELESNK